MGDPDATPCLQVMNIHDETDHELNTRARGRRCEAAEGTFQDQQEQDMNCKTCGSKKQVSQGYSSKLISK